MKIEQDYWTFLLFPQTLNHHLEINTRYSASKDIWTLNSLYTAYMLFTGYDRFSSVCLCVCKQQGQELREWQCVSGGQKSEPSDLLLGVSCLPAVTEPLASLLAPRLLPVPFDDSYPGNWKLFSKKDKRWVKDKYGAGKRDAEGLRGFKLKNCFVKRNIDQDCDDTKCEIYVNKTLKDLHLKTRTMMREE